MFHEDPPKLNFTLNNNNKHLMNKPLALKMQGGTKWNFLNH
jgi:hypothetical protein